MSGPSAQVSRPTGLGEWPNSRVWLQRQGMKAQAPNVCCLGRNLTPCSLGTLCGWVLLPLLQVYVPRAVAHHTPTKCAIHNAMSLIEQCMFLILLQITIQWIFMNRFFLTFSFMYNECTYSPFVWACIIWQLAFLCIINIWEGWWKKNTPSLIFRN